MFRVFVTVVGAAFGELSDFFEIGAFFSMWVWVSGFCLHHLHLRSGCLFL